MAIAEKPVYDNYDEGKVEEIKGITDTVTDKAFTNLEYPALMIKEGTKLPMHVVRVVSNMVKSHVGTSKKDINLYLLQNGETYKMGNLSGVQVEPFIDIVGREHLIGFYEDGKVLEDSLIFTLCSPFS